MSYYSFINFTGNGSQTDYAIPFPYLYKTHIKVYVQGILKTINVDYSFLNASTIQFDSAPLADEIITIKRDSNRSARLVDYHNDSFLKESTLDLDSNQLFYLMQEAFDALTLAGNEDGEIFTSPEAILNAITGTVDVEHLVASLNSPIGYWAQIHDHDAIYEYNEDGTSVYDYGVMGDGDARITITEDRIDAVVADTEGHTAQLALMANEFYVKLDDDDSVCGFGLYNGETSSSFVVAADTFAVMATGGEGDPIIPFIIDTESGLIAIAGNLLVGGSITAPKIAAEAIEATHIGADVIEATHIALGAVGADEIDEDVISNTHLTEDCIETPNLKTNCVTSDAINALAVDTEHLAALSISTAKLQVGSVDDTIIEDGAVTTQKLVVDAVTADKIDTGAVTADAVSTNEIITNAANIKTAVITGAKIGNAEVDSLQIQGNAVTIPVHTYVASGTEIIGGGSGWAYFLPTSITSSGAPITIMSRLWLSTATDKSVSVTFRRTDTVIETFQLELLAGEYQLLEIIYRDTPGVGNHTYRWAIYYGINITFNYQKSGLFLLETKR